MASIRTLPDDPVQPAPRPPDPETHGRRLPLHLKVLIGFVLGALLGLVAHVYAADAPSVHFLIVYVSKPFGQIFLNLSGSDSPPLAASA